MRAAVAGRCSCSTRPSRDQQRTRSADGDWRPALDLLAGVEPEPGPPLTALLSDEASAAGKAPELTVVTAALPAALVERLIDRAVGHHRNVSLVLVDPASFASGATTAFPGLLRLQAAGIAVVVLRDGDDLAAKLGAQRAGEAALG